MVNKMEKQLIRNLPANTRPYERLSMVGEKALTDAELLAILLKNGSLGQSSLTLAHDLLKMGEQKEGGNSLSALHSLSVEELRQCKGIGPIKAVTLKAALELGRRSMQSTPYWKQTLIRSPADAMDLFENEMLHLDKEELRLALLDTRHRVIKLCTVSSGGLASTSIFPREILKEAISANASAVVMAHNHPSGDPTPSQSDIEMTKTMQSAMKMMGIELVDHIIIGKGASVSLKELSYI